MSQRMSILTDVTLCTGCEACVEGCKKENHLGKDVPRRWKLRIDDLSATRFTTLEHPGGDHHVRRQCRHCIQPACVSACLVGALQQTPEGAVVYDSDRCMGCRYCMTSCPYGIPRYDWEATVPYVRKCNLCQQRLAKGGIPACVEACPEKATIFGTREEMLAVAHRRIEENPGRYLGKVYGETEIGGTSVIYISDIPLDFLGFKPDLGDEPLPERSWAALSKVPPLIAGMGGLMAGVWWVVGRRMKLAEEEQHVDTPESGETAEPAADEKETEA